MLIRTIKTMPLNLSKKGVEISEEMKSLLQKMIVFDPKKRITYEELFQHEFFMLKPISEKQITADLDSEEMDQQIMNNNTNS